jgi:5'-3' exonuclease
MRDSKSKISHLYPLKFEQDFLHKHHYWQGIPLLPHFDLDLIKQVYQENENKLTEDEKKRIKPLKEFIFN